MPSYVIMRSGRIGETVEATLCDPGVTGFPDRRTDVPVRVRLASEQTLSVDGGGPRRIISSESNNGVVTFMIEGSTTALPHRERRVALAQASVLLQQLRSVLIPLIADSAEPEVAAPALQELFDWLASERKAAVQQLKGVVPHDHRR